MSEVHIVLFCQLDNVLKYFLSTFSIYLAFYSSNLHHVSRFLLFLNNNKQLQRIYYEMNNSDIALFALLQLFKERDEWYEKQIKHIFGRLS